MSSSASRPHNLSTSLESDGRVDVLVDAHDDIAVIRALQRLARSTPTLLAISIPPRAGRNRPPVSEILWALGKRSNRPRQSVPDWHDADMWLKAYGIREILVLQAQYLTREAHVSLKKAAERLSLKLAFLHTGERVSPKATCTLEAFLARDRQPANHDDEPVTWPKIDDVGPLYCRISYTTILSAQEQKRVDAAFRGAAARIKACWSGFGPQPPRAQLRRELALATATPDDNLRHILLKGALLGLMTMGRAVPNPSPLGPAFTPKSIAREALDEVLADIDPHRAALAFLKAWTGLSDRRLRLIGPEQITTQSVAGVSIPEQFRPIFRAFARNGHRWEPADGMTRHHHDEPTIDKPEAFSPLELEQALLSPPLNGGAIYGDSAELVARVLARGLEQRRWPITRSNVPPTIRREVQQLVDEGILNSRGGRSYELTNRAVLHSATSAPAALTVDATPTETLLFLLAHQQHYQRPSVYSARARDEREHFRLLRVLSDLVSFGSIDPLDGPRNPGRMIETLAAAGYIAKDGPRAYELSDFGMFSLCWTWWPPSGNYEPDGDGEQPHSSWLRRPTRDKRSGQPVAQRMTNI